MLLLLLACASAPDSGDSTPSTVPWSIQQAPLEQSLRGQRWARSILHLHSPYSHDACDGEGLIDGAPNAPCLADLRAALCDNAIDVAMLTDHPSYAADQDYEDLLFIEASDEAVEVGGRVVGKRLGCEDGRPRTLWLPGIEDTLMPVGLDQHADEADYRSRSAESIAAVRAAGARVMVNHPEGQTREELLRLQEDGVRGVEAFNLHAMVDPNIRSDDLGLDPWAWTTDIAPFTHPDSLAEPDLLFLAFFQLQQVSLDHWDALSAVRPERPTLGIAGTDAHQNVLPLELRDGQRVDSYRRMIRWFSNWLLLPGEALTPEAVDAALDAGRNVVVFEVLGTPEGLDVHLEAEGAVYEIGDEAPAGELVVTCPGLAAGSPKGEEAPEVQATVLKDGAVFAQGCGRHVISEPGVYRVQFDITAHHLVDFLGEDPQSWLGPWPWILTNPIRVR
ncbi:MAG: hypothetical protein H6740_28075 [Alphaproteobacteria bacterium]|nr:hypothetical protein [Alphaproteobacteria bacterium]